MKKSITSDFAETFGQDMEHQQVKKIFSRDRSGLFLLGRGIEIPERDFTIFALQDILFLDDAFVQIFTEIKYD